MSWKEEIKKGIADKEVARLGGDMDAMLKYATLEILHLVVGGDDKAYEKALKNQSLKDSIKEIINETRLRINKKYKE